MRRLICRQGQTRQDSSLGILRPCVQQALFRQINDSGKMLQLLRDAQQLSKVMGAVKLLLNWLLLLSSFPKPPRVVVLAQGRERDAMIDRGYAVKLL